MKNLAIILVAVLVSLLSGFAFTAENDAANVTCSDWLTEVTPEVRVTDDSITLEFSSKDRKALETIYRLAIKGRIFGTDADGTPLLTRRIRRSKNRLVVIATSSDESRIRDARQIAENLRGDNPQCGSEVAVAHLGNLAR